MPLSISNIAWETPLNSKILPILGDYGFTGLEIAPAKYFSDIENPTPAEVQVLKNTLDRYNLKIPAFQALLFGRGDLKVFESDDNRKESIRFLKKIIDLAEIFEVGTIVYGSPKNRIIPENFSGDAFSIAQDFFGTLGVYAQRHGTHFCIEANPPAYGGNFINTTYEAAELVRKVNIPCFRLHIDAGTMIMNDEDFEKILENNIDIITHYHISQPHLDDFSIHVHPAHNLFSRILTDSRYSHWKSIEMLVKDKDNQLESIKKSLQNISAIY